VGMKVIDMVLALLMRWKLHIFNIGMMINLERLLLSDLKHRLR